MVEKRDKLIAEYASQASAAGCPMEQIRNFVNGSYIALPWSLSAHAMARQADSIDGPQYILLGGARGPGKSHMTIAQVGLDDCQRFPGSKWLFLRKIQKTAAESFDDLIRRVFFAVPHKYIPSKGTVEFPNGSRILLGGYNNESDIDKYIGIEYDGAVIEEANQISEEKLVKLRGSIRSSRGEGFRTRLYLSANPGGIGHHYLKQNFVIPYYEGRDRRFIGGRTAYFPSTYKDNPFLSQDTIDYLEALPGTLGRAWREGDWDAFEGQAFPTFDRERHVIDPIKLPEWWPRIRGVDWGYSSPFACVWLAINPDNQRVYVYREIKQKGLTDVQQARAIKEYTTEEEVVRQSFADPSMWASKNMEGVVTSTADEYEDNGVPLTRADNSRLSRKRKVDRLLVDLPDGKPGLQIFDTCRNLIEDLIALPCDQNNPEDVDTSADDHLYDALAYALTNMRVSEAPRASHPVAQHNPWLELGGIL